MTQAEVRFKYIVKWLIGQHIYPSPANVHDYLYRTWPEMRGSKQTWPFAWRDNMNGRQCKWRDEIFSTLPADHWVITQHKKNGGIPLRKDRKFTYDPDHDIMHVSNNGGGRGSSEPIPFPESI